MTTTIQISDRTWERLNKLKGKGESFQDVLGRLLKLVTKLNLQRELEDLK